MTAMVEKLAPADVLLADGSIAVVRPLRAADGPALHRLHDRVSDDAIRLRFFTAARHAAHVYVDHVLADGQTLALVAEQRGRVIGLATAEPVDPKVLRGRLPRRRRRARAGRRHAAAGAHGGARALARHYPVGADVLAENSKLLRALHRVVGVRDANVHVQWGGAPCCRSSGRIV